MSYYRRGYRRPTYRTNTVTSVSGDCTIAQRDFVRSLVAQIEAAQDHASPDLLAVAAAQIGTLTPLPMLLHETEWSSVPKSEVSVVIDSLKGLQRLFAAAAAPAQAAAAAAQYPSLPKHQRVITTKFSAKCVSCGTRTVAGTDLAVEVAHRDWQAWCLSCATTDPSAAQAAADALQQRLAGLAGLHLFDRKVYRISDTGIVEVRRGRRWFKVKPDAAPFSESTRVTAEVASAYADEVGQCINCGLTIGDGDDRRSIAVGYGPVCASRYGWYFPTTDEAEAIISRRRQAALAATL